MSEILAFIICGVFVVFMVAILVVFTLKTYKADQEYAKAIQRIREGKE